MQSVHPAGAGGVGRRQSQGDEVAQGTLTRYLRIIRVKHFEAATGDELAALVRDWFTAREESTSVDYSTVEQTVSLSEDRELMDWRYQVTLGGSSGATPGIPSSLSTATGEVHHIMLFYAE